jgi:hypothetical protein
VSFATIGKELTEVRPFVVGISVGRQGETGLRAIEQAFDEDIVG